MFEPKERKIAERIKDSIKNEELTEDYYIMLKNGHILDIHDYFGKVIDGIINPNDAYAYIKLIESPFKSDFYYPLLSGYIGFLLAYLQKLGFNGIYYIGHVYYIAPATGLKYVVDAEVYKEYLRYLSVEVTDLDVVVNTTNLRKIVFEVVDGKIISGERVLTHEEYNKIYNMFISQRLFAGHNVGEARDILRDYYDNRNKSFAKEVARIVMDYERIFQPYRVCYEMRTWKEVDCLSIELD